MKAQYQKRPNSMIPNIYKFWFYSGVPLPQNSGAVATNTYF